jgi:hypothetical protein
MNIISYILSNTYETSKCKLMLDAQKKTYAMNFMSCNKHNVFKDR